MFTDTIARVKELAAQRGISLRKLAILCDVPYSTLKSTELRGGQIQVDTIEKICEGLDIPLYRFFQ